MNRSIRALILATAATLALAGSAAANPDDQPASCNGYLSAWASPNMGFILQEFVLPAAQDFGIPPGAIMAGAAHLHLGGLEPCIP